MWLLEASSLKLKEFTNAPLGQYAILSHTWDTEEVTFQDMQADKAWSKTGYKKILKTCELAIAEGLLYAWVDTCCINKESSAELSEAVNSMFKWYADSAVCYAYLSDIDKACPRLTDKVVEAELHGDEYDDDSWFTIFTRSRWFTRGWTLQELIAPEDVRFYGRDWHVIGTRKLLPWTLWKATGIDPLVLEDKGCLSYFSVARKMSWAARRNTTRDEDRAYSLLGIFGVNIPLIYGEGQRAFTRLQEEIIRTSTDHSIFAWDDLRGYTEDLMLAGSPSQFANAKRTVRWHSWRGLRLDSAFRISNRGIEFDRMILAESKGRTFALLNCRSEVSPDGPLALSVERVPNASSEEFVINHFGVERLEVCKWRDDAILQHKTGVTILRSNARATDLPIASLPRFQLRLRSDSEWHREWIDDQRPREMWSHQGSEGRQYMQHFVMCPPAARLQSAPERIIGSFTVSRPRVTHLQEMFHVAFSIPAETKGTDDYAQSDFRLALSDQSQALARYLLDEEMAELEPTRIQVELGDENHTCSAQLSDVTHVLDDMIYVIDITTRKNTLRSSIPIR